MSDLVNKKNPVVITIARDFGAEGHEIGRILANELGIPLYDNELLVRASLRAGESLDKMAAYDERLAVENMAFLPDRYDARSYSDKLFQKMSQVILDLGETESCIIEGRLSDYLLRNNPNHIAVLVTAPFEDRVEIVLQALQRRQVEDDEWQGHRRQPRQAGPRGLQGRHRGSLPLQSGSTRRLDGQNHHKGDRHLCGGFCFRARGRLW